MTNNQPRVSYMMTAVIFDDYSMWLEKTGFLKTPNTSRKSDISYLPGGILNIVYIVSSIDEKWEPIVSFQTSLREIF